MKSLYFILLGFLFFHYSAFSQDKVALSKTLKVDNYKYYNHKSIQQKTYGWVAVGAGILLYGIGVSQSANNYYIDNDPAKGNPASKRTPYFIAGTLAELSSIVFFTSAKKNKKKASLALKNESAIFINMNNYIKYPSVSLSFKL